MNQKYYLLLILTFCLNCNAQIINFQDSNFKAKLLAANPSNGIAYDNFYNRTKIDTNDNGEIELSEASLISELYVDNAGITNLEGITGFINLYELRCNNNQLSLLNLNGLSNLYAVDCSFNQLTNFVYDSQAMTQINCSNNQLTSLDVSSSTLGYDDIAGVIYVGNNPITNIYALNNLPYLCLIGNFQSLPFLTNICCANQTNIDLFEGLIEFDNVTTATVDSSCLLGVTISEKEFDFRVYPNPVDSFLNIDRKIGSEMTSVSIYNMIGQLIIEIPNAQNVKSIDVSNLKNGNYFLKINSEKGSSNVKFIKQ